MTDYSVRHRCMWATGWRFENKQCTRRGRWLWCSFFFCKQHYAQAAKMTCPDVLVCIARGDGVQERLPCKVQGDPELRRIVGNDPTLRELFGIVSPKRA